MYSYLKGTVAEKNLDNASLVIEVSGVGYLVSSNLKILNHFPQEEDVKIYVSCQIKEDSQKLFGFQDRATRDIFEILLSVSGVGPKAALSILNLFDLDELISAVLSDKSKLIAEAQGIGPKTAQRIILELQNKLSKFNKRAKLDNDSHSYQCQNDVSSMLANLGYSAIEIDKSLARAQTGSIKDDTEMLVQFCLKDLSQLAFN